MPNNFLIQSIHPSPQRSEVNLPLVSAARFENLNAYASALIGTNS
jgi:hypothetical protein